MKRICLIIFLTICICDVLLCVDSKEAECFSFTWPGPGIYRNCTNHNIKYPTIPCIEPTYSNEDNTRPNTTKLWDDIQKGIEDRDYLSTLESNCVCIKYTYIYNGAVVNASYFCGKVIEDQAIAVTSGCYVTYTEGYTIEACACRSQANGIPCNSTIRNTYSILITFMATVPLFIYKIFNIP